MTATAATTRPPISNRELLAPTSTMADYEPHRHPNLRRLDAEAHEVIGGLQRIAAAEWHPLWTVGPTRAGADDELLRFWNEYLENLRLVHKQLKDGINVHRFIRDVRKHLPSERARQLEEAREAAIENIRNMRAFVAMLADADDDEVLGIEVVPPFKSNGVRGPSEKFEW